MKGFVLVAYIRPANVRVVTKAVPEAACSARLSITASADSIVAVELAGRTGCKIVWFPTVDAANETAGRLDGGSAKLPFWAKIQRELAAEGISPPPLSVIDEAGQLTEPTRRCLERIGKHNMILATGHVGRQEIFALVRGAKDLGVRKVLVTHAEFPSQSLTGEEQHELADLGAIIEHCFTTTYTNKAPWEVAFANIRKTGVSSTVISTDLGQTIIPVMRGSHVRAASRFRFSVRSGRWLDDSSKLFDENARKRRDRGRRAKTQRGALCVLCGLGG
jgi:hypothetical protein